MKLRSFVLILFLALAGQRVIPQEVKTAVRPVDLPAVAGVRVGVFREEVSRAYAAKDGVPSNDVRSVAITASGDVYAGTARGLARFSAGRWATLAKRGGCAYLPDALGRAS